MSISVKKAGDSIIATTKTPVYQKAMKALGIPNIFAANEKIKELESALAGKSVEPVNVAPVENLKSNPVTRFEPRFIDAPASKAKTLSKEEVKSLSEPTPAEKRAAQQASNAAYSKAQVQKHEDYKAAQLAEIFKNTSFGTYDPLEGRNIIKSRPFKLAKHGYQVVREGTRTYFYGSKAQQPTVLYVSTDPETIGKQVSYGAGTIVNGECRTRPWRNLTASEFNDILTNKPSEAVLLENFGQIMFPSERIELTINDPQVLY